MKGNKAKAAVYLIAAALMIQMFSLCGAAYDISKIKGAVKTTGAELPEYSQGCEQINAAELGADGSGEKDSAKAIQKALDYARDNASDQLQIKVFIPAGEYRISKTLRIYSNTWLYMEDGAVIKKCFDGGCMLKNTKQYSSGGYDADRNIIIEGGTWDGNTSEYYKTAYFSNIRIGHARNIIFRNSKICNNKNGHHLELGGIEGLTIENCRFSGYTGSLQKEAIQLDVLNNPGLFVEYEPFDDTATNNVVIQNNEFDSLCRGIGSHSAVLGKYYTNTVIKDNTFKNISGVCIIMYNHKKCTIENNVMSGVGMGIDFMYMSGDGSTDYFRPVGSTYEAAVSNINDDAQTVIKGNEIETKITSAASQPFGIRIYGKNVKGTKLPDHNYRVQGVKISRNKIKSAAQAVILDDAVDCDISGNKLSCTKDSFVKGSALIDIVRSKYITVSENTVSGSSGYGIKINGGKKFTVKANTVKSAGESAVCLTGKVSESKVSENTVKKPSACGILIKDSCSDISVDRNSVEYAGSSAICFAGKTTENISCTDNSTAQSARGICITEESKASVKGSVFSSNSKNIAVGEGSCCITAAPGNFTVSDITENNAVLTWDYQSEVAGYEIYRKRGSDGEYELVSDQTENRFEENGLTSKTLYFYKAVPYVMQGENKQYGNAVKDFSVRTKTSIEKAFIDIQPEMAFTGRARTQDITIKAAGATLIPGIDYTVEYFNNVNIGTAQVKITAQGDYCGEVNAEFDIIPMSQDAVKVVPRTEKPSSLVSKKTSEGGYSVNCLINDFVSLADGKELKTPVQISLESFKVRKTYLVSVRSYSTVDGTRIYGAWSEPR